MEIIFDKYKKVADFCYDLFGFAELPLYFSKFSNKIFSNYSKLFLLVYKQFRKFTYEDLMTDIASNKELRVYLGLKRIPHYTTLIKFAEQLPNNLIDKLLLAFKNMIPNPKKVAIDATGISLDNASPHYCKRIGLTTKKRPFMKSTFIFDIENYIILLCKMRKGHRHDTKDAKPLIKKLAKNYKPRVFYGDRGYDSNEIFDLIINKLKAYPLILQKNLTVPKRKRRGEYRKQTYDHFDYGEYLQRNKIETLNSIIKKRFGNKVLAKNNKMQKIEIITRIIAHNINRIITKTLIIIIQIRRVSY